MALKETDATEAATPAVVEKTTEQLDREARWATALINVEKQNPLAFAARKASGEFDKGIPDSFV